MKTAARITLWIDRLNDTIGKVVCWFAVLMVVTQFSVVVLRYVFGINFIEMQEAVIYEHGTLFMLGAAYTLLHEGHVRVDIFYRTASERQKALVDIVGVVLFLLPVCGLILWASTPYVLDSWAMLEGSPETSGLPLVYLLKSLIVVFAILIGLQGVALALRSFLTLKGINLPHPKADRVEV